MTRTLHALRFTVVSDGKTPSQLGRGFCVAVVAEIRSQTR
jgi:hypothetical protein